MHRMARRPWSDGIGLLLPNPLTKIELPPSVPPTPPGPHASPLPAGQAAKQPSPQGAEKRS